MWAWDPSSPPGRRFEHIFFDFDSTISVATWLPRLGRHAVSDDVEFCAQLTDDEVLQNFGGEKRLQALRSFLGALHELRIPMFILSHGRKPAIDRMLVKVGLAQYFNEVFSSEGPELQAVRGVKGKLIEQYLQQVVVNTDAIKQQTMPLPSNEAQAEHLRTILLKMAGEIVLFIDDTQGHLDSAPCRTHRCERSTALTEAEMQAILGSCTPPQRPAAGGGMEGGVLEGAALETSAPTADR